MAKKVGELVEQVASIKKPPPAEDPKQAQSVVIALFEKVELKVKQMDALVKDTAHKAEQILKMFGEEQSQTLGQIAGYLSRFLKLLGPPIVPTADDKKAKKPLKAKVRN